ncbi:hypothetical protein FGIG_05078 [Fasciola gigantica]|uniref:Uncharacterized protein n=1 Tax=Fasciola gigantica TaxID=46835 RepID=A0A504Z839_FASGI|nr:hypothetical protein FGIG_05078 [Fasciola gigantica]
MITLLAEKELQLKSALKLAKLRRKTAQALAEQANGQVLLQSAALQTPTVVLQPGAIPTAIVQPQAPVQPTVLQTQTPIQAALGQPPLSVVPIMTVVPSPTVSVVSSAGTNTLQTVGLTPQPSVVAGQLTDNVGTITLGTVGKLRTEFAGSPPTQQ